MNKYPKTATIQATADTIFMVKAVPNTVPSFSGRSIKSITKVLLSPSCIIGTTNATMDATYVIRPKLEGPRKRAEIMLMTRLSTDCAILHPIIQLAFFNTLLCTLSTNILSIIPDILSQYKYLTKYSKQLLLLSKHLTDNSVILFLFGIITDMIHTADGIIIPRMLSVSEQNLECAKNASLAN